MASTLNVMDGQTKVLIADDAPESRAKIRLTVQSQGWIALEAPDPLSAIELAERERPNAVVLGAGVRGQAENGFALLHRLRDMPATADIPVVMLTSRSVAGQEIAGSAAPIAFLSKPFGPFDLLRVLGDVLGRRTQIAPLGMLLLDDGRIRPEQLEAVLEEQGRLQSEGIRLPIGEMLRRRGRVSSEDVEHALDRQRATAAAATAAGRNTRVLVADGHIAVREGLRAVLTSEDDLEIVGIAADGEDALRLLRLRRPDVAVLDQHMPNRTGLDVLRAIKDEGLGTAVIIFSLDEQPREAARAMGAAFLTKDADPRTLLDEIRKAAGTRTTQRGTVASGVREAPRVAWHVVARQRRAVAIIGVLAVAYAGAFLVAESALGPSAALLSVAPVALAGALAGPEAGVVAALLVAAESVELWRATGHLVGEPVMVVGSSAVALLALLGIGTGFGVMRTLSERLDRRGRQIDALIGSTVLVQPGTRQGLALITDAACRAIGGDAALLYAASRDGLELVATTGTPSSMLGQREGTRFGPLHRVVSESRPRVLGDLDSRSFMPSMHSAIAVPVCPLNERPRGVLVTLAKRRLRFDAADVAMLSSLAPYAWLALKSSTAVRDKTLTTTKRSAASREREKARTRSR